MLARVIAVSAAVAVVSAQTSSLPLSAGCLAALVNVAASPEAACIDASSLVTAASTLTNTTSIVDPINTWLTGLCGQSTCSNASLAAIVTNVTTGCSAELSSFGFTSDETPAVISLVQQYYPTVQSVVCLKDTANSTLCVTETLKNVESLLGTLDINNIAGIEAKANALTSVPTNLTCTSCIKAAYNIINTNLPSLASGYSAPLSSQCGASFIDKAAPSGIASGSAAAGASGTSAAGGSATSSSAAMGAASLLTRGALTGLAVSSLLVVSSALAFLA